MFSCSSLPGCGRDHRLRPRRTSAGVQRRRRLRRQPERFRKRGSGVDGAGSTGATRKQLHHQPRPGLGEAHADEHAVTLGFGQQLEPGCRWSVALSLGRHDNTVSGARLEGDTGVGSLYGTWQQGGFYLGGALNLGRTGLDIRRSITLGSAASTERGSTVARQVGVDLNLGRTMGEMQGTRHGPVLGLSWLDQEVRAIAKREPLRPPCNSPSSSGTPSLPAPAIELRSRQARRASAFALRRRRLRDGAR